MPSRNQCRKKHRKNIARLIVLLWPLTLHAQGPGTAQSHIKTALRLYEQLDYDTVLKELEQAQLRARTEDDTVFTLLFKGIILAENLREEESTAAFQAALRLRPDAALPLEVAPKIKQRFNVIRNEFQRKRGTGLTAARPQRSPTVLEQEPAAVDMRTQAEPAPRPPAQQFVAPRVLVPALIGSTLLISGGVSWGLAKSEHSRLQANDSRLATLEEVRRSASRGRSMQTLGLGLMGVGLAGLGLAAGLHVTREPAASVSLSVGTNGASAFIQGRWP